MRLSCPGSLGEHLYPDRWSCLSCPILLLPGTSPVACAAPTLWEFKKCATSPGSARAQSLERRTEIGSQPLSTPWSQEPLCSTHPVPLCLEPTPDFPKKASSELCSRYSHTYRRYTHNCEVLHSLTLHISIELS